MITTLPQSSVETLLSGAYSHWQEVEAPEVLPIEYLSLEEDGYTFPTPMHRVPVAAELANIPETGFLTFVEPQAFTPTLKVLEVENHDILRLPAPQITFPELVEWLQGPNSLLPAKTFANSGLLPNFFTLTIVGDIILGCTVHRII